MVSKAFVGAVVASIVVGLACIGGVKYKTLYDQNKVMEDMLVQVIERAQESNDMLQQCAYILQDTMNQCNAPKKGTRKLYNP